MEQQVEETMNARPQAVRAEARQVDSASRVTPQQSCPSCAAAASAGAATTPSWIYAIGKIETRFPSLAIEKEYAQVLGRGDTSGLTDKQALHAVLAKPENRYLARRVCWVMTIEGLETYLLYPRDSADLSLLVESVRETPSPTDLDIVIGSQGPIATPDVCNGLQIPILIFDQVYSLDRETLVSAIPKPEKLSAEEFAPAASELFDRIMQMADNAGATDEHRALNYLAVRYPAVYSTASAAFARNASLEAIDVQTSPLSGARNIVEVVFSFRDRTTDVVDKFFTRVDITDEFPFLVSKMAPYFDR
ncbi:MAG TPA: hypothetical protein VHZ07_06545 [Bryobacteraceae bacterium]|jgi:hypothetical protein|nr:hypothetical protein [Bryobacteraceae bacterium]